MKLIYLVLIVFAAGCSGIGTTAVWKNDHIPTTEKHEIDALVADVFKAMKNKDRTYFENTASKSNFKNYLATIDTIFSIVQIDPTDNNYKIIDEYFVRSGASYNASQVFGNDVPSNAYSFDYIAKSKRTAICLFTVPDGYPQNKWLISCIFSDEKNTWKLSSFFVGAYAYNDNTAEQYFASAKKLFAEGKVVPCLLYMQLAMSILNPASARFHYKNETEIQDFFKIVQKSIDTLVKARANSGETPLQILDIQPVPIKGNFYPMIIYKSAISLNNVSDLENENSRINSKINTLLPGIRMLSDTIIYKATNGAAVNGQIGDNYGFVKGSTN